MSNRKQANIDRINQLWGLHEPEDEELRTQSRCLAFAIDRRDIDSPEGVEMRVGVSFGPPVVGPETKQGFFPIPVQPGQFVFGVHLIGTKGNQLTLYDRWKDALAAGPSSRYTLQLQSNPKQHRRLGRNNRLDCQHRKTEERNMAAIELATNL